MDLSYVEVLNKTMSMGEFGNFLCCILYILILISIIALTMAVFEGRKVRTIIAAVSLLVCIFLSIYVDTGSKFKVPTYQVLISDEANFNDIYDNYDIIKVEGRIYTIKEKK